MVISFDELSLLETVRDLFLEIFLGDVFEFEDLEKVDEIWGGDSSFVDGEDLPEDEAKELGRVEDVSLVSDETDCVELFDEGKELFVGEFVLVDVGEVVEVAEVGMD